MNDANPETLLVRQHERIRCSFDALIQPSDTDQGGGARLARSVGDGTGKIRATVIDCSGGGIGITARVFLPRTGLVSVWVVTEDPSRPILFEGLLRVQRTAMLTRDPTYYLGAAFVSQPEAGVLSALLGHASLHAQAPDFGGGRRA